MADKNIDVLITETKENLLNVIIESRLPLSIIKLIINDISYSIDREISKILEQNKNEAKEESK